MDRVGSAPVPVAPPVRAMNLGIFGGTFDPVHRGHLTLARHAFEQCGLDQLLFVPAGYPPHRPPPHANAAHRQAMLELAIADEPQFAISPCELTRRGPTHSIDTLAHLAARHPTATLFLLLGGDAWRSFRRWHRWADILDIAQLVVLDRAATAGHEHHADKKPVAGPPAQFLSGPPLAISATAIRAALKDPAKNADQLRAWLPAAVLDYIAAHRLYR